MPDIICNIPGPADEITIFPLADTFTGSSTTGTRAMPDEDDTVILNRGTMTEKEIANNRNALFRL